MKFLIQLAFGDDATPDAVEGNRIPSAKSLWNLYSKETIREMYVRGDQRGIVFIAEAADIAQLLADVAEIPLVKEGLLNGEIVQLAPFTDMSLAFA